MPTRLRRMREDVLEIGTDWVGSVDDRKFASWSTKLNVRWTIEYRPHNIYTFMVWRRTSDGLPDVWRFRTADDAEIDGIPQRIVNKIKELDKKGE